MLGCGSYQSFIRARGGNSTYMMLPSGTVNWTRVLCDTSDGTYEVASVGEIRNQDGGQKCCDLLGGIRDWQHELAIIRSGEEVWVGPVITPTWGADDVSIDARDLSVWFDHRLIHYDHSHDLVAVDLSLIFQEVAIDAMAPDNSPGISVVPTSAGILSQRSYLAAQLLCAGQELRSISTTGVDWTFIARACLAGKLTNTLPTLGPFIDEHLVGVPKAHYDGTKSVNRQVTTGGGSGTAGPSVQGQAVDVPSRLADGLLETVTSDSTISTNSEAAASAASSLARVVSNLPEIEDIVLAPNAPVAVSDLIPGRLVELNLSHTCVPIRGTYRLAKVTGKGTATGEQIALTLQTPGTS